MLAPRPVLALLVVATSTCVDEPRAPTPACQAVLDCYFDGDALSAVPGFDGLFPGTDIVTETYGVGGTCWTGDDVLAQSCDDRCKGLLWQDCARSYRRVCDDADRATCLVDADCVPAGEEPPAGICIAERREGANDEFERPFCSALDNPGGPDACNEDFALRCRFEDFAILQSQGRQEDEPLFSACPAQTRCNAVVPPFEGPFTQPDLSDAEGCCENTQRGLLVGDRDSCNVALPPE